VSAWSGRKLSPREADLLLGGETMDLFRNQLLIVLANRLGGNIAIPAAEVDGTGGYLLSLEIDPDARTFALQTRKKQ
jgi:hypothetical protein